MPQSPDTFDKAIQLRGLLRAGRVAAENETSGFVEPEDRGLPALLQVAEALAESLMVEIEDLQLALRAAAKAAERKGVDA